MPHVSPSTPQQLLRGSSRIIVPTDVSARQLRTLHDEIQRASGLRAWAPADVLTWDQWLRSLWSQSLTDGSEARLLMNKTQEHALWRDVITAQRGRTSENLSSIDSLADLAANAWALSEAYGATSQLRQHAIGHDARIFAEWAEAFARSCRSEGFLSRASLDSAIASKLRRNEIQGLSPITFAGFPKLTPAQAGLLENLRDAGCEVHQASLVAEDRESTFDTVLEAESEEAEFASAAHWIRAFIESRHAAGSSSRVGVLIPDLDACHDQVAAIFRSVLAPEQQAIISLGGNLPFELAAFKPLTSHPLVGAALALAHWPEAPLSRDVVSSILLSPYLTPPSLLGIAAAFDASSLRQARLLRPEVGLSWLRAELWRQNTGIEWPSLLTRFLEGGEILDTSRSFAHWSEFIRRLVRSTGWPGETPDAHDLVILRAWDHALDTVATLDYRGTRATYSQALQALERELSDVALPSAVSDPLVQVLAPADAEGATFDAVIFARATDANWPSLPSPNPLIGWQLQAQLGMPGADRKAALNQARVATEQIRLSSGIATFSYSKSASDNEQRLSPLVAELDLPIQSSADIASAAEADSYVAPEIVEDMQPLTPLASPEVHGGASVLQHQAACGFRAFAEIRLRSQKLEAPDVGFDARERGNLLHSVLQRFWQEVQTHRALKAMPTEECRAVLTRIADECLTKQSTAEREGWDPAYLRIQQQRLVRLLMRWLGYELERSEFAVRDVELKTKLSVGEITLDVRVDRIDQTEAGEVLVDYKTSYGAAVGDWEGERPDEPQLPMYSLLEREQGFAGLTFAKVRPGPKMGWQGYASTADALPGKDTMRDMDGLREGWYATLTTLADSFAHGDIRVDPKNYPTTCNYCAQRLLCRLDSAALLDVEDPTDPTEEDAAV